MKEIEIEQKGKDLLEQLKGLSFKDIQEIAYQLIKQAKEVAIVD